MVARRVEASPYGERECCGVDGVEAECCGGRGRGRACEGACSGGPDRNEFLPHSPLGPCRCGVCGLVA